MRSATCLQTLHILLSFALKAARKALVLCVINSSTSAEARISFTFDNDVLRVGLKNFPKDYFIALLTSFYLIMGNRIGRITLLARPSVRLSLRLLFSRRRVQVDAVYMWSDLTRSTKTNTRRCDSRLDQS